MSRLDELIQELCPDGVEYDLLKNISEMQRGTSLTKKNATSGNIPVVSGGREPAFYCDTNNRDGETITVAGSGAGAGYVQYWIEPIFVSDAFSVKSNEKTTTKYLYYCLEGKQDFIYSTQKGGGVPHVHISSIENMKLPVPPLEVQREIVRILDSFMELTAELIAKLTAELTARKKQYEFYRDELLNNNQNVNVRVGKLIDMLSQPITDGPHTTPVLVDDGIPFLSAEAVSDGKIHFDKKRGNITKEFDEECCKKYKPQRNDVFMVKSGSTTGKVGYVDTDERFNIWSPIAALRVNDNNSSRYLFHLLQSTSVQNMIKSKASHGSQPNLGMRVLEQFEVPMPPLDVQIKIAEVLDNFDAICSDLNIGLPAEIEARQKQYEYYRDALLTYAATGKMILRQTDRQTDRQT